MKFGRKPRGFDTRIPQMAALRAGQTLPPLPTVVNYASNMPADLGMMLNDALGDCTCAAVGHAIQVWTANAAGESKMLTPPDNDILALYEIAGGYVPGNPNTDQGAMIQTVLTDWLNDPVDGNELAAFVEINQRDTDEIRRSIWECGVADIGFEVPSYMPTSPGSIWDVNQHADQSIIGGHSVDLVGYDRGAGTFTVISWGARYTMTEAFLNKFCDEAYALANQAWVETTGQTPAGLTIAELEALMQSMIWNGGDRQRHRHLHRNKRRRRDQTE